MQSVILLEDAPHQRSLRAALADLGCEVLAQLCEPHALQAEVERLRPDLIVVTADTPSEETLITLGAVSESCPRPVVIFAKHGTRELIRRAVDCGVAAYVVDGWAPERLTPIIEAAVARFEAYELLRKELAREAERTQADRKGQRHCHAATQALGRPGVHGVAQNGDGPEPRSRRSRATGNSRRSALRLILIHNVAFGAAPFAAAP
jgi:AmiR/NasT family two-component response regulator